jgi:hypothetical protein
MIKTKYVALIVIASIGVIAGIAYISINRSGNDSSPASVSIIFSDSGFETSSITVIDPTIVTFENHSSRSFRPMSRQGLSPYGPCIDNTDEGSCKPIPPGKSWTARFDTPGAWGYYDTLSTSSKIVINVRPNNRPLIPVDNLP